MTEPSVWNPRWPWWFTAAVVMCGLLFAAVVLVSDGPWWLALIVTVAIPSMIYLLRVQVNLEWRGYRTCPTCRGSGKVEGDE